MTKPELKRLLEAEISLRPTAAGDNQQLQEWVDSVSALRKAVPDWSKTMLALINDGDQATKPGPHCKRCDDQGEVFSGDYHYYGEFDPPEPIMEPCPDCEEERAGQPAGEGV